MATDNKQAILRNAVRKANKRRFDAAGWTSTLQNWVVDTIHDFDDELRTDLNALRSRSRDAALNDVYARAYFEALKTNVVGKDGIQLKSNVRFMNGKYDTFSNERLTSLWSEFSKSVTTDGLNMQETQKLIIETVARDGEIFIVKRRGDRFGKHKMELQLFEAEYCDHDFNAVAKSGNIIRSGIEYDEFGKIVAYHLYKYHPKALSRANATKKNERIRFSANDVIHVFNRERITQGRGFPWISSALIPLTHLREYQKSELVASRVASAKMGFYTRPRGEEDLLGDGEDENDANAFFQEAEAGMFDILPDGYSIETFDPQNPNANFGNFVKKVLQGVASSLGVAYHTLSNDLESTSYSSLRQGAIEERDTFKSHQQLMIDQFLTPVFEDWLSNVLAFRIAGTQFPVDMYDKFNAPIWKPRTWAWIDPQKETAAIKLQLEQKIRSRTDVARSLGWEYDDVLAEIAEEQALAEKHGVSLTQATASVNVQATPEDVEEMDDDE